MRRLRRTLTYMTPRRLWTFGLLHRFQDIITFTVYRAYEAAYVHLKKSSWRLGVVASVVRRMNEVTVHWARLVLGWVTVFGGRVYHHGM